MSEINTGMNKGAHGRRRAGAPTRRRLLQGASALAGFTAGSGALGGFPTIWAQNIKEVVLNQAGSPVAALPQIAEQATKDLGFTIRMQATENSDLLNRFLSQSSAIDCGDVSIVFLKYLATKYLNGHSDVIGGIAIVGDDHELSERLRFLQNAVGGIAGPFDSFLVLRGVKTLALRMERHCSNALAIAASLDRHPLVRRVIYPGLPTHPQHALARRQMNGFGGMVTIELATDLAGCRRVLERVRLFTLAESLGGTDSLIEHPAIMTHASVPAELRRALGIGDSLVRLSIGIEDVDDLIADLHQALAAITDG